MKITDWFDSYEDCIWFIVGCLLLVLMFVSPLNPKPGSDDKTRELDTSKHNCLSHAFRQIEMNNGLNDTAVHCSDGTVEKIRYRFIER